MRGFLMAGKHELVELFADAVATAEKAGLVTRGQLLELLDKAPSSFGNEMNPWPSLERKNKLGIEDAHTVLKLINDARVVQRMAHDMGYRLVSMAAVCPDQPTLPEELLDDLPSLTAYHDAIRQGLPIEAVNAIMQLLIHEIEQDFVAYREQQAAKAGKAKRNAA